MPSGCHRASGSEFSVSRSRASLPWAAVRLPGQRLVAERGGQRRYPGQLGADRVQAARHLGPDVLRGGDHLGHGAERAAHPRHRGRHGQVLTAGVGQVTASQRGGTRGQLNRTANQEPADSGELARPEMPGRGLRGLVDHGRVGLEDLPQGAQRGGGGVPAALGGRR